MSANNLTKWISKCEELHFSDSCIKGMAFYLGLNCHESKTHDQAAVNGNMTFFLEESECYELIESIDLEKSATVFYGVVEIFNSLSAALEVDFPQGRMDSNGKPTSLFTPHSKSDKFLLNKSAEQAKLADIHELYESFFTELGYIFSANSLSVAQSFCFSDKFVLQAALEDVKGFTFFTEIFKTLYPPIFIGLLNKQVVQNMVVDHEHIPFQFALSGYLQGQDMGLCNFIWNNQRIIFYNQQTLEPQHLDFQWGTIVDFIDLLNAYVVNYWAHDKIKQLFKDNISILSKFDQPLSNFEAKDRSDFYGLIFKKIEERDGYSLNSQLSPSNALQYKACLYFNFIFTLAANPGLLPKPNKD